MPDALGRLADSEPNSPDTDSEPKWFGRGQRAKWFGRGQSAHGKNTGQKGRTKCIHIPEEHNIMRQTRWG